MSSKSTHSSSRRHDRGRTSNRSKSPRRSKKDGRHKHEETSSKKEIQKGIEKAKNRLKSSLNEAIDDGRNLENSRPTQLRQEKHDSSDIIDSVSLQAAIERIEEPGFRPCSFKSDADSARSVIFLFLFSHIHSFIFKSSTTKGSETASTLFTSSATTQHDRAMFGPLWASKQIAEKATNKKEAVKKRTDEKPDEEKKEETNVPASRFPMAHEKLSEDIEVRNQRWLQLFRERRKMAIEGIL
ncbi:hypothetical protein ACQ4LE_006483 [Meloidogyne hapla]